MNHRWDGKESCGTTIDVYSTRPVECLRSWWFCLAGAQISGEAAKAREQAVGFSSLVLRRSLLILCPREVWERAGERTRYRLKFSASISRCVTAHGRVQEWPIQKRPGTRLGFFIFVSTSGFHSTETSGSNFRQLSGANGANATAFFKISKNREALRGMPKISKKFSRKFSLHSTLLPKNLEFSVEWFAFLKLNNFQNFWKLFREISVPFAAVSTTPCRLVAL